MTFQLRLLGTVGEPINPEAWMWYRESDRRQPLSDRRHVVADGNRTHHALPDTRRDRDQAWFRTRPFPGVVPEVVTMEGKAVPEGSGGFLVHQAPWPGMLRTVYGDPDR